MQSQLSDATFDKLDRLQAFAADRGVELLDVALGGLAAQPTVSSVIAGATSPEQVKANVKALLWTPSGDDLAELNLITGSVLATD